MGTKSSDFKSTADARWRSLALNKLKNHCERQSEMMEIIPVVVEAGVIKKVSNSMLSGKRQRRTGRKGARRKVNYPSKYRPF